MYPCGALTSDFVNVVLDEVAVAPEDKADEEQQSQAENEADPKPCTRKNVNRSLIRQHYR